MKITIQHPEKNELDRLGVSAWPVWECAPSTFDWHYDQEEVCFLLEGEVTVKTASGEVHIGPGDFVTFARGLHCTWTVNKAVRKHYSFR